MAQAKFMLQFPGLQIDKAALLLEEFPGVLVACPGQCQGDSSRINTQGRRFNTTLWIFGFLSHVAPRVSPTELFRHRRFPLATLGTAAPKRSKPAPPQCQPSGCPVIYRANVRF